MLFSKDVLHFGIQKHRKMLLFTVIYVMSHSLKIAAHERNDQYK